jgi:ABC-type Fe3+-hydroxamate transport system substrate-binding protein
VDIKTDAFPVSLADARGLTIALSRRPNRIVSLVPSLTELLADLGLDEQTVGVTRFCERPAGWKERKQIVGGTKNVHVDRVRALSPDLILANLEENTRDDVEALDAVAPVYVTDVASLADALSMIRLAGLLTGANVQAAALAQEIGTAFESLPSFEPLRSVYLIWQEPYMTIGGDTFIHDMMSRAGFTNVFGDATRYPIISLADMAAAKPDVVLLSTEPYPFKEQHAAELTAHLPETAMMLVDGQLFSWYGSRMLKAPAYFKSLRLALKKGQTTSARADHP